MAATNDPLMALLLSVAQDNDGKIHGAIVNSTDMTTTATDLESHQKVWARFASALGQPFRESCVETSDDLTSTALTGLRIRTLINSICETENEDFFNGAGYRVVIVAHGEKRHLPAEDVWKQLDDESAAYKCKAWYAQTRKPDNAPTIIFFMTFTGNTTCSVYWLNTTSSKESPLGYLSVKQKDSFLSKASDSTKSLAAKIIGLFHSDSE